MSVRTLRWGWLIAGLAAATIARAAGPDEQRLLDAGIQPTAEAIRGYLELLVPAEEQTRRLDRLLAALGDDDFWVRDEAAKALRAEPIVPVGRLRDLRDHPDAEVRWQAERILDDPRIGEHSRILFAALATVRQREITGLVDALLVSIPRFADDVLRREAARAIGVTAREEDLPRLRTALASERADVRLAAIEGLAAAGGPAVVEVLRACHDDPDEEVRYAAAVAVLNFGERDALARLVGLLDATNAAVRMRAVIALREASGKTFGFSGSGGAGERAEARARWAEWARTAGGTAELTLPVGRGKPFLGRIIVSAYTQNRVLEIDFDGKILWTQPLPSAFACHGLPDGSRVVASYSAKRVVEYDAEGRERWSATLDGALPTGVERLDNGRTLVAAGQSRNQVVEIDQTGKVVWSATVEGGPTDAKRLPSGNTLCALYNTGMISEIDSHGKVVWKISTAGKPYSVCPMPDGSVLAAELAQSRVVIYSRDGKTLRTFDGLAQCYSANVLPDGRIVVGTAAGVVVIGVDGSRRTFAVATGVVYAFGY